MNSSSRKFNQYLELSVMEGRKGVQRLYEKMEWDF